MFGALRDCVPRMAAVRHMPSPKHLTDVYDKEIYGYFKEVKVLNDCYLLKYVNIYKDT